MNTALGLFDMRGNAGEWTDTRYAPNAIAGLYAKGKLNGPASGRQKIARAVHGMRFVRISGSRPATSSHPARAIRFTARSVSAVPQMPGVDYS